MTKIDDMSPRELSIAMQRAASRDPQRLGNPNRWAEVAELPKNTVRDAWNARGRPQLDTMMAIAKAAGLTVGELLLHADDDWEVKATIIEALKGASIDELRAVATLLGKKP